MTQKVVKGLKRRKTMRALRALKRLSSIPVFHDMSLVVNISVLFPTERVRRECDCFVLVREMNGRASKFAR